MWCHNSFLANVTFYYSASSWYPPPQQWLWSLSGDTMMLTLRAPRLNWAAVTARAHTRRAQLSRAPMPRIPAGHSPHGARRAHCCGRTPFFPPFINNFIAIEAECHRHQRPPAAQHYAVAWRLLQNWDYHIINDHCEQWSQYPIRSLLTRVNKRLEKT